MTECDECTLAWVMLCTHEHRDSALMCAMFTPKEKHEATNMLPAVPVRSVE